jgi:serine protease Do
MKKILVLVFCLLITTPTYGDHYSDKSKKEKFTDLKDAIVLITTEISQDVRQPSENPFDKFLNPNKDDGTKENKTEPVVPNQGNRKNVNEEPIQPPSGMGTGFFIDEHHIVTNYHVVQERNGKSNNIKVYTYSYPFVIEDVTLIGYDAEADIAVLRINKDVPHSILEWETERPYAGQDAWAIGHGAGQIWSITYGIISNTYRPNYSLSTFIHYWQTDAVINSGNSGGPLLDENGHVIGVNTLIISPTKFYVGYGYAVPGLLAKRVAEQIIETGYHVKPSIGIMMGTVEDEEYYADLQEKGVDSILEVKEIIAGTPAEHFGIQSGDIITAVDGKPIFSSPEVIEILWTKMPGDELELEIFRNEEFIKITVILDQSAPAEPRSFIGR